MNKRPDRRGSPPVRTLEATRTKRAGQALIELPRRTIALAPTPEHAAEVARYVEQLTTELAAMARSTRLDVLAYILEMARHEAHGHAIQHKTDA